MKRTILYIIAVLMILPVKASGRIVESSDDGSPVSDPEIIYNNGSAADDNRELTFPFCIEYDVVSQNLSVDYYQDYQATLYLTDANGATISSQTLMENGNYAVILPNDQGVYYLFMVTPRLCAYVSVTLL